MLIPDFTGPDIGLTAHAAVLDEISGISGCTVSAWALPPDSAARRARSVLRVELAPHVRDQAVLDDLELMVCELATNAAVHTDGPYASAGPGGVAANPAGIDCRAFLTTPTLIGSYDKTDGQKGRHGGH